MAILGRETLKRYFETGKGLTNRALADTIDSFVGMADSTAQTLNGDFIVGQLAASRVSAGEIAVTNSILASGATFTGVVKHGVSAAASAESSLGYLVLSQEATAAATAQVALLPDSVNIVDLGVRVLSASSGAAGGTVIYIGNAAAIDYFGSITVSAVGDYDITSVSARRLQSVSGAVFAAAPTATAASNFVAQIHYYPIGPAPSSSQTPLNLSIVSNVSAIGNMVDGGGGLARAFDGNTNQGITEGALAQSTVRGFVGQAWDSPKRIGQFAVWDGNDDGWHNLGGEVDIRLKGANTNNIAVAATLASVRGSYISPTVVVTVAQTEIDTTNAYSYTWVEVSGGNGTGSMAIIELKFWELL